MNSFATTPAQMAGAARSGTAPRQPASPSGVKGLAAMFLAAAVAALVIVADRVINTWGDEHLFYAWVVLWAVVFAGIALFAGTARSLALRLMPTLDRWSQAMAETRAEMRVWEAAQRDPRLMQELVLARQRAADEADFSEALAPLDATAAKDEPAEAEWIVSPTQKVNELRGRAYKLYYI